MNGFIRTSLCVLLLFMPACGTLEITVEATPNPDVAATGAISALQTQNAELATKIAMLNSPMETVTPTSSPQPTATSVPLTVPVPAVARIAFLNGATVGMVSAPIQAGQSQDYVLQALQGQPMFVYVGSPNKDVTVSIKAQDGTNILSAAAHQNSWQGSLLQTEDYYLTIHGGASTENFSLTVTIPARIQFAAGADSATVSGTTVSGYGVSYAVFANKGQTMNVDLGNLSAKASLSIYGFTDGQSFIRSEKGQTSYHFVLPTTQEYIIVVVPPAGSEVSYNMMVQIQLLQVPTARLALQVLQNAKYHSADWGDFQLADGIYYRTPLSGESPQNYFTRLEEPIAYGDLNADGIEDATVILRTRNGGTGAFAELAVILNQNGNAYNIATVSLGDRVAVLAAQIRAGIIILDMRVDGPNDPLCCPSQLVTWQFRLESNQLIRMP